MQEYGSWWEEKRAAFLYGIMVQYEPDIRNKKLFHDLQMAAEKQASLWQQKFPNENLVFTPDSRTRLVAVLIKNFGTKRIKFMLSAMKIRGMSVFTTHQHEHRHTSINATSNLRAAIFGINDGLVSNMSLILGIAGANANQPMIVLAGVAGLLAGACSMGAGEYISVRSQREVFEYQIALEKQELAEYPEEEMEELSLIYQARGIAPHEAKTLAKILIANPDTGLDTLAREELGINPDEMVSPLGAMIASFSAFAIGAFIPLIPFIYSASHWNLIISILLTSGTLFSIGAMLSLYTNRNAVISGLRMLAIGLVAGGITYGVGHFFGIVAN